MTVAAAKTPSPFARMATTLLTMPPDTLADPTSKAAMETREVVEAASFVPGRMYLDALQERRKTPEHSDQWLHATGAVGAVKRMLADHAAGYEPERLRLARAT